ncbi:MAG: aminotransferase class V-fold PLP-dependent enzyme [Dissulfurispiraceae bacterium]|nr:aminotransferase class V-fold PLP-dependent enzyme [Dissulfurispiraceae bacterium]
MYYLDNAATTFPKPQRVNELLRNIANNGVVSPGRGSHAMAHKASDAVSHVRTVLARFFGALDSSSVALCFSATDALNLGLKGFLNDGDHVIISSMEHNSVLRPLRAMEYRGFISLDIVQCDENGCLDPEQIINRFNKNTKLVVISHASNVTGAIQPVEIIGKTVRERGAYLLVDAAQSAGILRINIEEMFIDMLAFTGHKSIYGLQGTGGLVIGSRIKSLRPFREGGTGLNSISEFQPNEWPETFEAGTPNVPGILSMGEGLAFIEETGLEAIRKKGAEQLDYLWSELSGIDGINLYGPQPGENRISVLSFNLNNWEPGDVGSILNHNHGIYVRTGLHCSPLAHQTLDTYPAGTVRLSPGFFTQDSEIETAVKAIRTIARTLLPY